MCVCVFVHGYNVCVCVCAYNYVGNKLLGLVVTLLAQSSCVLSHDPTLLRCSDLCLLTLAFPT